MQTNLITISPGLFFLCALLPLARSPLGRLAKLSALGLTRIARRLARRSYHGCYQIRAGSRVRCFTGTLV